MWNEAGQRLKEFCQENTLVTAITLFKYHKKRVQNAVLGCNIKNDRMISVRLQGKPFNITAIQVYALTSNAEEAEFEWFCEDIQDLLELLLLLLSHFSRVRLCATP